MLKLDGMAVIESVEHSACNGCGASIRTLGDPLLESVWRCVAALNISRSAITRTLSAWTLKPVEPASRG